MHKGNINNHSATLRWVLILALLILSVRLYSQTPGKPINEEGIAIFRDEEISDDRYVRYMRFLNFIDRRAENNINAGYVIFCNDQLKKHVSSQNIIDVILNKEIHPKDLEDDNQLKNYELLKNRILNHAMINNVIQADLQSIASSMDEIISKYNRQYILRSGEWISRREIQDNLEREAEKDNILRKAKDIRANIEGTHDLQHIEDSTIQISELKKQTLKFSSNESIRAPIVNELLKVKQLKAQEIEDNIKANEIHKMELEKQKNAEIENLRIQQIIENRKLEMESKIKEKQQRIEALGL